MQQQPMHEQATMMCPVDLAPPLNPHTYLSELHNPRSDQSVVLPSIQCLLQLMSTLTSSKTHHTAEHTHTQEPQQQYQKYEAPSGLVV